MHAGAVPNPMYSARSSQLHGLCSLQAPQLLLWTVNVILTSYQLIIKLQYVHHWPFSQVSTVFQCIWKKCIMFIIFLLVFFSGISIYLFWRKKYECMCTTVRIYTHRYKYDQRRTVNHKRDRLAGYSVLHAHSDTAQWLNNVGCVIGSSPCSHL
jgi:hypothetical protein